MDDTCRQKFLQELESERKRYTGILESLFGPCDRRFVFGTIGKSEDDSPCTYFPSRFHTNGGCVVDIHIGQSAWEILNPEQSAWQLAHECVHLIDPGKCGSANVLEEGLATWFQDELQFHNGMVKKYIVSNNRHTEPYCTAKRLVAPCMPELGRAVKKIRESGTRIRDISVTDLDPWLPAVDRETKEYLCSRFGYSASQ